MGERPKALTSSERRSLRTAASKENCKEYVNGKNYSQEIWAIGLSSHCRTWGNKQLLDALTVVTWISKHQEHSQDMKNDVPM